MQKFCPPLAKSSIRDDWAKKLPYPLQLGILFCLYFYTAKQGLALQAVSGFATFIWLPSGISLAALFIFGLRVWPAILAAAIAINVSVGAPPLVACFIGAGNTLEAIIAFELLRQFKFCPSLERIQDVFALVIFAAILSTLVSAGIGTLALFSAGIVTKVAFLPTMKAWWFGDALSDLVVAPFLLVWLTRKPLFESLTAYRLMKAIFLSGLVVAVAWIIFGPQSRSIPGSIPLAYLTFPLLIWVALRFGQQGAVLGSLTISIFSIWGTILGYGPFTHGTLTENIWYLEIYRGSVAITLMIIAASVAERALSEKRQQEANLILRTVIEGIPDAIFLKDVEGCYQLANTGTANAIGKTIEEVIGKNDLELFPIEAATKIRQDDLKVIASGPISFAEDIPRQDGGVRTFSISKVPYRDKEDKVVGVIGIARDITEQKRLLMNEEKVKRRLKVQYKVMSVLADSKDLSGAALKVIQVIADEMGWDISAFWCVSKNKKDLEAIEIWHRPLIDAPEFIHTTKTMKLTFGQGFPGRIWENQKPLWIADIKCDENFLRKKSAEKEYIRGAFGFPILYEKTVLGIVEFFSHEVREPDEEWLEAIATMGGQIGQFMKRIATEEELRRAIDARDEFLSIASHELKTPLSSLSLQLQLADRSIKPETNEAPPPAVLSKSFKRSLKQVRSLGNLVDDLLDVSKMQRGKLNLNYEETDLTVLVKSIVEQFAEQLKAAKCLIEINFPATLVGDWDPHRIEQVLVNLISNIIKYAPGKLAKISAMSSHNRVRLTVEDSGSGIPKDKQERIFERFERATSSTNISGLGLGLFVVKRIVEAHRGRVRLESSEGEGSKFIVDLPRYLASEKQISKASGDGS
jgi:PAS domain S-box-containing protein